MSRTKAQIKGDLTFTHSMMLVSGERARLTQRLVEAETGNLHALIGRVGHGIIERGMTPAASARYHRVVIDPQRRKVEAAKVAAAVALRESNRWVRLHDDAVNRASGFSGWVGQ